MGTGWLEQKAGRLQSGSQGKQEAAVGSLASQSLASLLQY